MGYIYIHMYTHIYVCKLIKIFTKLLTLLRRGHFGVGMKEVSHFFAIHLCISRKIYSCIKNSDAGFPHSFGEVKAEWYIMSTEPLKKIQRKLRKSLWKRAFFPVSVHFHMGLGRVGGRSTSQQPLYPVLTGDSFLFFLRFLFTKTFVKALKLATPVRSWWGILRCIESALEWPVSSLSSAS